MNWQIAVPNGVYTAVVDFGEDAETTSDANTHGCEVEGSIICPNSGQCVFYNTVWVTDGYFTITGKGFHRYSCHSISMVKLTSGAAAPPPESLEFYFGSDMPVTNRQHAVSADAILDDGTGFQHHDPADGSGSLTATFEIFKFNLDPDNSRTGLRDWSSANSVQIGEIALYDWNDNVIPGAYATNPVGIEPLLNGCKSKIMNECRLLLYWTPRAHCTPCCLLCFSVLQQLWRAAEPRAEPMWGAACFSRRLKH